jgi:putative transposase
MRCTRPTTALPKTKSVIVVEDLHVAGMVRNRRLARPSKTCSNCGLLKTTLPPEMRLFSCTGCGLMIDRDLNAARNLALLAGADAELVAASSAET